MRLVGLRKRKANFQDGRLHGRDWHRKLPEKKSKALEFETTCSVASYRKAAKIFLLFH
jgi:hypothetical protein